jgi:hypothetical protein
MPGARTPTDPRESRHDATLGRCLCSLLTAWFPGGATLSRPSSRRLDSSVLASRTLTLSPSASIPLTRLKSLQGGTDAPLAYKILCVRFTCVVHDRASVHTKASLSFTAATLDTGGWLVLTRPGLAPGKKRQASLGALTTSSAKLVERERNRLRLEQFGTRLTLLDSKPKN